MVMSRSCPTRVLVVDDEALIAMLIEDMLSDLGCQTVGPALELSEATDLAREADFDCAILDLNMHGETTYGVAEILRTRNIPFAFASGYANVDPAGGFETVPILSKPFTSRDIAAAIEALSARLGAATAND
jgi:CheY-like chemotaxis protein